ncbi:PREDICTED: U-box domain-containing protein 33-like isoform X6 [Lupinus angustifolius]|uniref:U-box domain-containing protein 33-like isoform X6 n=1 Tax=Lupinus angustifolius TaxID=3871 RepID=UPI00092ED0E8|nr:PREDICTED: U-box domain-containing protein 33-like isoform X6 [Lupinus angustifolius]
MNMVMVNPEPLYVAVSKDLKENKLNLIWAIQNSGTKRICILHVHVPPTLIPFMGAKYLPGSLKEQEDRAYQEFERQNMHKTLDDYLLICQRMGVQAEKLHIEMDSIEKGILELISQYNIQMLVMGAASDKNYSRRMMDLRSKKAIYVCEQAPASCHLWFICKGHLIQTREHSLDEGNVEAASPLVQKVPNSEAEHSLHLRSHSHALVQNHGANLTNPGQELFRRVKSANDGHGGSILDVSFQDDTEGYSSPCNQMGVEVCRDESNGLSKRSPSGLSTCPGSTAVEPALTPNLITEQGGRMNDTLYDQHEQPKGEAENATRNAYRETFRREKAEKDFMDTIHMVDVLSKIRHPNLITLIGACPETCTLVYEYLPNGSLEDRLACKDNTPPLSWQTRIRIAAELCSALIFLHSSKPHSIVHGDLKPSNILLDSNLISKLSDFGICHILSLHDISSNNTTLFKRADPTGTFAYMDPQFLSSGELTPKSDVYSFGIILLRLLTGRQALGITEEVKYALDTGKLNSLLDPLAGDWPFVKAEQLTRLALRCCEMNRKSRPDLHSDVWRTLEPMRVSSGGTNSFGLCSERHYQPPYFICPIFQEVMQDPHVAADGFTYEAEAIRGWLDSGHDTSPMTNSRLTHHNLVPNHALRSSIQDWLQAR